MTVLPARAQAPAEEVITLDALAVHGRSETLVGLAATASEGIVGSGELAARPFLRRGELLEVIPGLVVTQHSGGGKANQYFLRGFNLDHGTDFAVSADGVPVNMRTHAHGQGYADINFIVPELVESVSFRKGPFFAESGDFSAAGSTDLRFFTHLPTGLATISVGQDDYYRAVAAASVAAGDGHLTLAGEVSRYDGPFDLPEDFRRTNAFVRYHRETPTRSLTFTLLGYDASWDSTDQIPRRAVDAGDLSRFGTIDATDGGASNRFGATFDTAWLQPDEETRVSLFATRYRLNLFSNFTYFLDDPVNGDQFEQVDRRWFAGGTVSRHWHSGGGQHPAQTTIGLQARSDFIDEVALNKTVGRRFLSNVRSDRVRQHSAGLFARHEFHLAEHVRVMAGLRGDFHTFDVESVIAENSGTADDFIASPKLSLILNPAPSVELYASAGTGFHSNDARGTTIRIDPVSGDPADPVDPLVRSRGLELGFRAGTAKSFVSSVAVFALEVDSELLFVGDAGNTEASGATRRVGVEFANFVQLRPWLLLDFDVGLTRARFRDAGPEGDRIPGAIDTVVSAGLTVNAIEGFFGALRARYFGPRDLVEDASVEGEASFLCHLRLGYRHRHWEVALDVLNLFNRRDNDIEYFYESRLPGEADGGEGDIHFHPVEPRTVRAALTYRF